MKNESHNAIRNRQIGRFLQSCAKVSNRIQIKGFMLVSFLLLSWEDASAYLDPGTGSYVLQILLAGVLGGLYAIKIYWNKLKSFLSKRPKKENENTTE